VKVILFAVGLLAMLVMVMPLSVAAQNLDTARLTETFLNQDPDPAEPGKYVELRWKVEKAGNSEIKNIIYELDVEYPFFFDEADSPTRDLGNWEGLSDEDDFATLFYKIRVDDEAVEDTYKVKLRRKTGFADAWIIEEYNVRVGDKEIPKFTFGQLSSSPTKLASDLDEAEINVELANIGDGNAENVVLEIVLPNGFSSSYSFSDRDALGTIPAGSSKTASFTVDIDKDVSGGSHTAMVRIKYKEANDDENEVKTKMMNLELTLTEKPMFEVENVSLRPETVVPGTEAEIHLMIRNTGGEEADSVSVRAFKDSSQPIGFIEKSDFIGKLKPGELGEAILLVEIESDAEPKTHLIDIEIRAVDNDEVIVQEKTISFHVDGTDQADAGVTGQLIGGITPVSLVVVVVVLIVVGYASYRAGKRNAGKASVKA
jgi:hypothetical protein